MSGIFNVYCDESCHLEHDRHKAMVLGAIWCLVDKRHEIAKRLREIKVRHHLPPNFEMKWTKVSPSKLPFYLDCIDYFFDDDDLHFRAVVIPDKASLDHPRFGQKHDDWYYKMYFILLKAIFDPEAHYRVYIDIKDTLGHEKIAKLHDVLCHNSYDFSRRMLERVQRVHSHEVELLQLVDLLIGALSYLHRGLKSSTAKQALIARCRQRSRYSLQQSTLLRESKFNLLIWNGSDY